MYFKSARFSLIVFLILLFANFCYGEIPRPYTSAVFTDIDNDGDKDLIVSSSSYGSTSNAIRILINNNNLYFIDETSTRITGSNSTVTEKVVVGDFNEDGKPDILAVNSLSVANRLLLNNGSGQFTEDSSKVGDTYNNIIIPNDEDSSISATVADINSDNKVDYIYIANDGGQQNRLYIYNTGISKFADKTSLNLPSFNDYSFDAAFGDLDNDGDVDIFVANGKDSGVVNKVYLNNGSGSFSAASTGFFPQDTDFSSSVIIKDFSGDNKNDIFVTNAKGQQNRLYIFNSGTSEFEDKTANLPQISDSSWSAVAVDVDNDGDYDIFVANDGQDKLLINNGSGHFTEGTLPVDDDYSSGAATGDANGDDKPDIFVTNFGGNNRLLINDGTGVFTDKSADMLPHAITGEIALSGGSKSATDVTVTLSGDKSATTNPVTSPGLNNGIYSFEEGLEQGKNYTVTPTLPGYIFDPTKADFTSLSQDEVQDFTEATYTISGTISLSGGSGSVIGVTVTLSGGDSATTNPGSDGKYTFSGLEGDKDYTVTPTLTGYAFTPTQKDFTALSKDETQDFSGTASVTNLSITTTSPLPAGKLKKAYSGKIEASGGTTPYTWKLASGKLPPRLRLNKSTGAISGKPTTRGTFKFKITVTDSSSPAKKTKSKQFVIKIK